MRLMEISKPQMSTCWNRITSTNVCAFPPSTCFSIKRWKLWPVGGTMHIDTIFSWQFKADAEWLSGFTSLCWCQKWIHWKGDSLITECYYCIHSSELSDLLMPLLSSLWQAIEWTVTELQGQLRCRNQLSRDFQLSRGKWMQYRLQ